MSPTFKNLINVDVKVLKCLKYSPDLHPVGANQCTA